MAPTMSNPRDLYLALLSQVLFVERMLSFEVLPDLLGKVTDPELSEALGKHLAETKEHVTRAEAAFRAVGAEPSSAHDPVFVAAKDRHATLSSSVKDDALADVLHAHAAALTEHQEIVAYRTLVALAGELGSKEASSLLGETLSEEEHALGVVERAIARLT